jgi:tRNA uridine 5-carboxymethylaminomethyl modification enzyme
MSTLTGQDLGDSLTLAQLSLRPHIDAETLRGLLNTSRIKAPLSDVESTLADFLYSGYLQSQEKTNRRINQHDSLRIPQGFAFSGLRSVSHEMIERLNRAQPSTFGQARKIPGLTPAALSHLLVELTATQRSA